MCCWPIHLYGNGLEGPHKRDLDAIVPDQPVWLASDVGHSIWVNSVALEMMGVDRNTPDPVTDMAIYGRDTDGELTGWIKEKAYRSDARTAGVLPAGVLGLVPRERRRVRLRLRSGLHRRSSGGLHVWSRTRRTRR